MSFDAAAVQSLFDQAQSHVLTLGVFETVNTHEAKSSPGNGLNAALWVNYIGPFPPGSGLAATTGFVVLILRCYSSMTQLPLNDIDPNLLTAVTTSINSFTGDIDLGTTVRNVDVLGATGYRLEARAGYVEIDKRMQRVMDVTVPVIINDMWTQVI